jgi:hypothetical protein
MNADTKYEHLSIHQRLLGYPFRVWIFSIITTPLFSGLWNVLINKTPFEFSFLQLAISFLMYLVAVAVLLGTVAPALFIYMLLFWKISAIQMPVIQKKLLLFAAGSVFVFLTTLLLSAVSLLNILSVNGNIDLVIFSTIFLVLSLVLKLD